VNAGSELVTLTVEEGVGLIVINNPPVNVLNAQVLTELEAALDRVAGSDEVRVVIITGAGERAFVAGADISEFPALDGVSGRRFARRGQGIFAKIPEMDKVVIAAINGYALGGGCELALACDIRVVAENARMGQPEVNLGIIPGYGGTQRLARLVGEGRAKYLIFTGEMITAQEAYRIGLADVVAPAGGALEQARKVARTIMSKGPVAVALAKRAITRGLAMGLEEGLRLEADLFGCACGTEDKNEGSRAFLEKRLPQFKGR
jgi:enoyl-CoA hydratase